MTDPKTQREQTSLKQLDAVLQARQVRLQTERRALAERERKLAQAWQAQAVDEALIDVQQSQWSGRWKVWANEGGALRHGISLRRDQELLAEMAALVARHREELQMQADVLAQDFGAWVQRWRGAQALESSQAERVRALRISGERASERLRDEESLMAIAGRATVGVGAASVQGGG